MGWNLYYIPDEEPTYEEAINRIGEAAMLDPVLLKTALRLGEGLKPRGQTAVGWWNYYKNAAERMNKDWVRRYKGYVNASSVVRAMIDDRWGPEFGGDGWRVVEHHAQLKKEKEQGNL